jgi:hypothetical protein
VAVLSASGSGYDRDRQEWNCEEVDGKSQMRLRER